MKGFGLRVDGFKYMLPEVSNHFRFTQIRLELEWIGLFGSLRLVPLQILI